MNARDIEAALHARCLAASQNQAQANDQIEANVFRVAAMVLQSEFPVESKNLMKTSEAFFRERPNEKLETDELFKRGWITDLPRLKSMLSQAIRWQVIHDKAI